MFIKAITLMFAMATLSGSGHFFSSHGVLSLIGKSHDQSTWNLTGVQYNKLLSVEVTGTDKGGDLDCYILIKRPGQQAYSILSKQEDAGNQCSLNVVPHSSDQLRLWVINNGSKDTHYQMVVKQ